jgi:hypothetical protein
VDEDETTPGVLHHLADLLAGLVERCDRRTDRDAVVPRDLGGHPADAADVGLAVGLGEREAGAQVPSYDVAVEARHRAPAVLDDLVVQRPGDRGLAAAGEAGEEDDEAAHVVAGLVLLDDGSDLGRPLALAGHGEQVAGRVVGGHLKTQLVVVVRIAVGGQRRGHDVGRGSADQVGGNKSGADQADGGDALGGAGAVEGEQHDGGGPGGCDLLEVGSGQRCCDGNGQRSGVLLADLGRREVQPPERAVGRRREWAERPGRVQREREALGVDQLDLGGIGQVGRECQRDARVRDVEGGAGCECPGQQQLQIVQLAWTRAVLRCGHRAIVPDRMSG